MALGTRTKFQLEILITTTISAMEKFEDNILESRPNVSETTPRSYLSSGSTDVVNIRPVPIQLLVVLCWLGYNTIIHINNKVLCGNNYVALCS